MTDYEDHVFHTIYMLLAIVCREAVLWKTLALNVLFQYPEFCSVMAKDTVDDCEVLHCVGERIPQMIMHSLLFFAVP